MQLLLNNKMLHVDSYRNSATFSYPDIILKGVKTDLEKYRLALNEWKNTKLKTINNYQNLKL